MNRELWQMMTNDVKELKCYNINQKEFRSGLYQI